MSPFDDNQQVLKHYDFFFILHIFLYFYYVR